MKPLDFLNKYFPPKQSKGKMKVLCSRKYSDKHVIHSVVLRWDEGRAWRFKGNWLCNYRDISFFNLLTPFARFQKCNGSVNIGLGNHYLDIGYSNSALGKLFKGEV